MTLDMELNVPEYNAKLYYHSSRRPTEEMVKKICESLDLARDIVNDAQTKLSYALTDPKRHPEFQASWGDTSIPDTKVAKEAVLYHFLIDTPSPEEEFGRIINVIGDTLDGLDAVNGDVTVSDVLSQYRWDLYKVYVDRLSWEDAREELRGKFRPKSKHQPTADKPRSGYVLFKEWEEEFLDGIITRSEAKSIHIEFSNVTQYPMLLLALAIVHEATHKFAHTEDHAYTDDDEYQKLTVKQRIENADSFAYVVISIALNQLIKDLEQFLEVVPRNDTRGPTTIRNFPVRLFTREERRMS